MNDLKGKIPEAKKDFVNKLIDGKSLADQLGLLPDILKEVAAGDFGGTPNSKDKSSGDKQSNIGEAKTLEDALGMIFAKKQS